MEICGQTEGRLLVTALPCDVSKGDGEEEAKRNGDRFWTFAHVRTESQILLELPTNKARALKSLCLWDRVSEKSARVHGDSM